MLFRGPIHRKQQDVSLCVRLVANGEGGDRRTSNAMDVGAK